MMCFSVCRGHQRHERVFHPGWDSHPLRRHSHRPILQTEGKTNWNKIRTYTHRHRHRHTAMMAVRKFTTVPCALVNVIQSYTSDNHVIVTIFEEFYSKMFCILSGKRCENAPPA